MIFDDIRGSQIWCWISIPDPRSQNPKGLKSLKHNRNFRQTYLRAQMELKKNLDINIEVEKSYLSNAHVFRAFGAL